MAGSPPSAPRLAPAPPPRSKPCQGHGKSARSLRGKSVQMRPSKRVGRDGEGGGMTPGLALLFPSLTFPANNPVNAQEQLWESPAPRRGGARERWVPAGGDSPRPAPPASPQPPGPEQGPSWDGKRGRAVSADISICFGAGRGGQGVEGAGGSRGSHGGSGRGNKNPPRTWRGETFPLLKAAFSRWFCTLPKKSPAIPWLHQGRGGRQGPVPREGTCNLREWAEEPLGAGRRSFPRDALPSSSPRSLRAL